ncbi:MAG TPA: RluA family pseudouridine synthase [Spirochaetia bacterium]|nr:RluA family pseudouridine synthase [Spirochaetia bacterium]
MPDGELSVLYEDEWLIAVDKPAGVHTAPLRAGETGTLLDRVLSRFPEISRLPGVKPVEPGLLHRLDQETSGVVVVARTEAAFRALRELFERGDAVKDYRAACRAEEGRLIPSTLRIESRFAPRGPGRRMVRVVLPGAAGKAREATRDIYTTEAGVEERRGTSALLSAVIRRGFRHQVRAHLSYLGLPIFGDDLYGVPAPAGAPARMYLHACGISFAHPLRGGTVRIVSPLPDAFHAALG